MKDESILYFLVEGGKPMEIFKSWRAQRVVTNNACNEIAKSLHVKNDRKDLISGIMLGVVFDQEVHPDFTKPDRRTHLSYPKKGTDWYAKFAAQNGTTGQSELISKTFEIPLSVQYTTPTGKGSRSIGAPLNACGFLFKDNGGPVALYIPDVKSILQDMIDQSSEEITFSEEIMRFKPIIEGCRRITEVEWTTILESYSNWRYLAGKQIAWDVKRESKLLDSLKPVDIKPAVLIDEKKSLQENVKPWLEECFGVEVANDKVARNHRFLEEALELVQAGDCTQEEAHQLVDYVFNRPVGEKSKEVGGVMITLAAWCLANDVNMHNSGDVELARIWTKVEAIREKSIRKTKHSPLP